MRNIEEEIRKLNSHDIKRQNPLLEKIAIQEKAWISDFNKSFEIIFAEHLFPIIEELIKAPNIDKIKTRIIEINGKEYKIPENILQDFHKSYIQDPKLRQFFEDCLKKWFRDKTQNIKSTIKDKNYQEYLNKRAELFSLATLAISSFHKNPGMILRKAQKRTAIAMSENNIAELASGEGKTLAGVLTAYLQGLTKKGVYVITANSYLSKRDFDELLPIYEGLGITAGYNPASIEEYESMGENISLDEYKRLAYKCDITFGTINSFAFDYLRDNLSRSKEEFLQREYRPGFAIVDEADAELVDNARVPFIISENIPMYVEGMSLEELCTLLHLSYDDILEKVKNDVKNPKKLSYKEARYISINYGNQELLEDPEKYQQLANDFFNNEIKVFYTKDNMYDNEYGLYTSKQYYRALSSGKYKVTDKFYEEYGGVIYCDELKEYKVLDETYDAFLEYCYTHLQINSQMEEVKEKLVKDENYVLGKDYYESNGELRFSPEGAKRIIIDPNYPKIVKDFEKYMTHEYNCAIAVIHYLHQAITANLIMKNGENYSVINGEVKVLKDKRIQEGSTYSDGLHQAIEIKEKVKVSKKTKESLSISTISQYNFLSMFGMVSGMTGTAAVDIFGNVFKKGTIAIPRAVVEERDPSELLGVEINDLKVATDIDDKINLIIEEVEKSQSLERIQRQPVLIVASDSSEIEKIHEALTARGWPVNVITSETSPEEEAKYIAMAGRPGYITLSTEMTGRGTDIILGGDRDLVKELEISARMKERIQNLGVSKEGANKFKDLIRALVTSPLEEEISVPSIEEQQEWKNDLEKIGLKVIISGLFKYKRSENQVIGRTGRNGVSGECCRFACIQDFKNIGIDSITSNRSIEQTFAQYESKPNGELIIDDNLRKQIDKKVASVQNANEKELQDIIMNAQELNSYSADLMEEYRDQRRNILSTPFKATEMINQMIAEVTDAIISSYVTNDKIDEEFLTRRIVGEAKEKTETDNNSKPTTDGETKEEPKEDNNLKIDFEAISLEIKRTLGVTFDPNVVYKSNMNLLEFRDAIIRTAQIRNNSESDIPRDTEVMCDQNDFVLREIPELLERSFTAKNLSSTIYGYLGEPRTVSITEFGNARRKILFESYKYALRKHLGIPLSYEEFIELEKRKKEKFALTIKKNQREDVVDANESSYEENNSSVVNKIRAIKKKLDEQDRKTLLDIDYQIRKDKAQNLNKLLEKQLDVRPMIFIEKMVDGNIVREFRLMNISLDGTLQLSEEKGTVKGLLPRYVSTYEKKAA